MAWVHERYSFSDLPRAIQVQLAGIGPLLFGAVVGFMLGESAAAYWALTALSVVGGIAGGLDHSDLRAAAARGLVAGAPACGPEPRTHSLGRQCRTSKS